jgi:hypothetical protein
MTVNRAPVKTAWAYVVATRLGFDVQEALSIAHVHVHISSMKHALMLGNILNKEETREAEAEIRELPGDEKWLKKDREREGGRMDWRKGKGKGRRGEKEEVKSIGSSQPWVGIMRARWVFVCRSYISC